MLVRMFTDGSCPQNPGTGGWAAIVDVFGENRYILSGASHNTTNNRMEMMALLSGLIFLRKKADVVVHADSQYVINPFQEGWLGKWQSNGWKTSSGKAVENIDLWRELIPEVGRHYIELRWTRGHDNNYGNELADRVARSAVDRLVAGVIEDGSFYVLTIPEWTPLPRLLERYEEECDKREWKSCGLRYYGRPACS